MNKEEFDKIKENLGDFPIKIITVVRIGLFLIGFLAFLFMGVASMNPAYLGIAGLTMFSLIYVLKNFLELKETPISEDLNKNNTKE